MFRAARGAGTITASLSRGVWGGDIAHYVQCVWFWLLESWDAVAMNVQRGVYFLCTTVRQRGVQPLNTKRAPRKPTSESCIPHLPSTLYTWRATQAANMPKLHLNPSRPSSLASPYPSDDGDDDASTSGPNQQTLPPSTPSTDKLPTTSKSTGVAPYSRLTKEASTSPTALIAPLVATCISDEDAIRGFIGRRPDSSVYKYYRELEIANTRTEIDETEKDSSASIGIETFDLEAHAGPETTACGRKGRGDVERYDLEERRKTVTSTGSTKRSAGSSLSTAARHPAAGLTKAQIQRRRRPEGIRRNAVFSLGQDTPTSRDDRM